MPEPVQHRVPAGGRAPLYVVGLLAVVLPGLFLTSIGAWAGLVNPLLPVDVRCVHVLEFIFVRHVLVTTPWVIIMTGGMHLLVTAVMRRHRLLLNFGTAAVLTWVVVVVIVGFFLMGQVAK